MRAIICAAVRVPAITAAGAQIRNRAGVTVLMM
jgi:hypothetical protein